MAKVGSALALPEPPKPLVLPVETAALINITNVRLPIYQTTYGNYTLPFVRQGFQTMREEDGTITSRRCEPGEEWAGMRIKAARGVIDRGPNPKQDRMEFVIHAREIALDLCRQCNSDIWGIGHSITGLNAEETEGRNEMVPNFEESGEIVRGFSGVFLADADEPTTQELLEMRELLRLSDATLKEEGDRTWDEFKKPAFMHEGFKRAARRLGLDAEWLYSIKNVPDCPHCGSKLRSAKASVCATCGRDVAPGNAGERSVESEEAAMAGKGRKHKKAAA